MERDRELTISGLKKIARKYILKYDETDKHWWRKNNWYPQLINRSNIGFYLYRMEFLGLRFAVPIESLITFNDFKRMADLDIERRNKRKNITELEFAHAAIKRGYL